MKKIISLLVLAVCLVGCVDSTKYNPTTWEITYKIHYQDGTVVKHKVFENGDTGGRAYVWVNKKGTSNTLYIRKASVGFDIPVESSMCPIEIVEFEEVK